MNSTTTPAPTHQIPVDPGDLIAAVRSLLVGPDTTTDAPIRDRAILLEDICSAAASLVTVVSTARTVDRLHALQEQRTVFREVDLNAIERLAARLLDAGPHIVNEIDALEDEQATIESGEVRQ